jgi:hypothetical protein
MDKQENLSERYLENSLQESHTSPQSSFLSDDDSSNIIPNAEESEFKLPKISIDGLGN